MRLEKEREDEKAAFEREKRMQRVIIDLKKRYGKNAVLKGTNFKEGATTVIP